MKKSIIVMMMVAVLLGTLLVSCNQDSVRNKDILGEVRISLPESKSITASVTSSIPEVSSLKWYYVAKKADAGLYATGQTDWSSLSELVTGTVLGNFSQGRWEFSFYGYDTVKDGSQADLKADAVYFAEKIYVRVSGETVTVPVALSVGTIAAGKVVFDNLKYIPSNATQTSATSTYGSTINGGASGSLVLKVYLDNDLWKTSEKVVYSSGLTTDGDALFEFRDGSDPAQYEAYREYNIASGSHELRFDVEFTYSNPYYGEDAEPEFLSDVIASNTLNITISEGVVFTFAGDVSKSDPLTQAVIGTVTGEATAEASIEYTTQIQDEPIIVSSNISPASVDSPDALSSIIVEFAANSIPEKTLENDTYRLETNVTGLVDAASDAELSTFVVTAADNESISPVAAIDLSLYKNEETVATSLTAEASVTITTYIAKGLTSVAVYYNGEGDAPELIDYDPVTGLLKFKTKHFSEFAVGADQYVYDKNTNTAYKLNDDGMPVGIDNEVVTAAALDGHELVLLDSKYANDVSDDIDNFNSGFNWTVVHSSTEPDYGKLYFEGGWGTRIEPYLIGSHSQLVKMDIPSVIGSGKDFYYALITDINAKDYDTSSWAHGDYYNDSTYYHVNMRAHKLTIGNKHLFGFAVKLEMCNGTIEYDSINSGYASVVGYACASPDVSEYEMYFHDLVLTGSIKENTASHYGPLVSYAFSNNGSYYKTGDTVIFKAETITSNMVIDSKNSDGYVGGLFGYVEGPSVYASVVGCIFNGSIVAPHVGSFINTCSAPKAGVESSENILNGSLLGTIDARAFGCNGNITGAAAALEELNDSVNRGPAVITILPPSTTLITVDENNEVILNKFDTAKTYRVAVVFNVDSPATSSGGFPRFITVEFSAFDEDSKATGLYEYAIIQESSDTSEGKQIVVDQNDTKIWIDGGAYHLYSKGFVKSNNTATIKAIGYIDGEIVTYQNIPYQY